MLSRPLRLRSAAATDVDWLAPGAAYTLSRPLGCAAKAVELINRAAARPMFSLAFMMSSFGLTVMSTMLMNAGYGTREKRSRKDAGRRVWKIHRPKTISPSRERLRPTWERAASALHPMVDKSELR